MAKMKKVPMPKVASDAAGGSDVEAVQGILVEVRKSAAMKESTKRTAAAVNPPPKFGAMEKKKRKADVLASSRLEGPSASNREKEAVHRKKGVGVADSDCSSLETSGHPQKEASDAEADSNFEDEKVTARSVQKTQRRRGEKADREFTKSECLKQLASLKAVDKRPPPPMTADIFASRFGLHNEGINSHRLKMGKGIALEEVEEVFGKEKAMNGFLLAEKLSKDLRKDTEKLYCVCYQRHHAPAHVAKEFAIGIVLDKVRHQEVNRAEFASETNAVQRKSYSRRLKMWIQGLASIRALPVKDVYESEGFVEYFDSEGDKVPVYSAQGFIGLNGQQPQDQKTHPSCTATPVQENEVLVLRKTEVQELIEAFQIELKGLDNKIDALKNNSKQEGLQWEACSQLMQQIQSSLTEAGHECSLNAGAEQIAAASSQVGLGPIMKMFQSTQKKLEVYSAAKSLSDTAVADAQAVHRGSTARLSALQTYLEDLSAGRDAVLMRPLPICNNEEAQFGKPKDPVLPSKLVCCVCCNGFPLWDVILSVCQHVYHPWCASHWFKSSVTCAVPMCGLVPQLWYKSFGFGVYNEIVAAQGAAFTLETVDKESPAIPVSRHVPELRGAPSVSACDSTFSKSVAAIVRDAVPTSMQRVRSTIDCSPCPTSNNMDGCDNPFAFQQSTPCAKPWDTSTFNSPVKTCPTPLPLPTSDPTEHVVDASVTPTSVNKTCIETDVLELASPKLQDDHGLLPSDMDVDDANLPKSPQCAEDMDFAGRDETGQQNSPMTTGTETTAADAIALPQVDNIHIEDPYELPFSLDDPKPTTTNTCSVTPPTTAAVITLEKGDGHSVKCPHESQVKGSRKGMRRTGAGKGVKHNSESQELSPPRVLRTRPTVASSAEETAAPHSSDIAGSKKNKGDPIVLDFDLTKGIESVAVAVVVHDGESSDDPPAFDKSYTYIRSPGIHCSVRMEGQLGLSSSKETSTLELPGIDTTVHKKFPCLLEGDDLPYLSTGLLHPRYVKQLHRIRRGSKKGLVYCSGKCKCLDDNEEVCEGYVPLQCIQECNKTCSCPFTCPNRVVQRGLTVQVQVYFVDSKKGWGIRTLQYLKPGSFVFKYAGEVVTNAELIRRGDRMKFSLSLNANWLSEITEDDDSLLCIDSTSLTNVARWLNHRCGDANLMDMPVWVDSSSPLLYHVAFFANRLIFPGEELTWDYGLGFDEDTVPFLCHCGSSLCRGR